jgi:ribonucleoside-diphosphate reductase subunit M1
MSVSSLTRGGFPLSISFDVTDIGWSIYSNIYTRRVLAGEFQVVCPWLLRELVDLGLWNDQMKNMIIAHNGSVQNIPGIPDDVKAIYKTVWEISQKKVLDLAADRGAFICQSQSLNVHLQSPTLGQLTSMHFYGWKKGLKTGMYYLRTRPAAQAIQFTVDQSVIKDAKTANTKAAAVVERKGRENKAAITPPSPSPSPVQTPARPNGVSVTTVKQEPITPTLTPPPVSNGLVSPPPSTVSLEDAAASMSLNEKAKVAAAADPEFAAALQRQRDRELEEAQMLCSIENKEACMMCSG